MANTITTSVTNHTANITFEDVPVMTWDEIARTTHSWWREQPQQPHVETTRQLWERVFQPTANSVFAANSVIWLEHPPAPLPAYLRVSEGL